MRYQDRLPPDGINTPNRHPLRDFLKLSVLAVLAIVVFGFLLNTAGGTLGGFIPFKYELWLAEQIDAAAENSGQASPFEKTVSNPELQQYLQSVADQVAEAMEIEDSMPITLHYSDDILVNAYATIGGHVYFFKGLLSLLPHENALAMLMAHEFSHVTLRHTAKGIGGGLTLALGSSMMGISTENQLFGFATTLTSSRFSRKMETEADKSALHAVNAMYGHINGADALFKLFMQQRGTGGQFEKFLSTHPLDEQRIERVLQLATDNGWQINGEVTSLPVNYKQWLG